MNNLLQLVQECDLRITCEQKNFSVEENYAIHLFFNRLLVDHHKGKRLSYRNKLKPPSHVSHFPLPPKRKQTIKNCGRR